MERETKFWRIIHKTTSSHNLSAAQLLLQGTGILELYVKQNMPHRPTPAEAWEPGAAGRS